MSIRGWIVRKLDSYSIDLHQDHGIVVRRDGSPDAFAYCIEPSPTSVFDEADFASALDEMPELQFLILVRRDATDRAYELAAETGVCLDGFGEFQTALRLLDDVSEHRSREIEYLLNRLEGNRATVRVVRRGKAIFEIHRSAPARPVIIVAIDHYEVTSDGVYALINSRDGLKIDAIVSTNPYARGFAPEAVRAASNAGVDILPLNEFLSLLGSRWN
ncbi:hypothetical protein ACFP63_18720 [Oerskovia jenensis]|uniref:Uncharacterized protein n=1 Tax=Oerskovia jenensis TaxID=162169 RepID=A0ABS2LCQ9_9CELL|nr:hypothetical protein [Oerskovia jenensis]MBM7477584.1 hypothetical protein [Oerskovia jenensis]